MVFMGNGETNRVNIMSTTPAGYIGLSGNVLTKVTGPVYFNMVQTTLKLGMRQRLFLAGVGYSMNNVDGVNAMIFSNGQGQNPIPAVNIMILPVIFYSVCTSSTYTTITTDVGSLNNWLCNQEIVKTDPNYMSYCDAISIIPSGWTNLSDCQIGKFYTYCVTGTFCGTSNCNGPCPTTNRCMYSIRQISM